MDFEELRRMFKGKLHDNFPDTMDFWVCKVIKSIYTLNNEKYYKLGTLAREVDYGTFGMRKRGETLLLPTKDFRELDIFLSKYSKMSQLCFLYMVTQSLRRTDIFKDDPVNAEYHLAAEILVKEVKQMPTDDLRQWLPYFIGLNFAQAYNNHKAKRVYRKDKVSMELNKIIEDKIPLFDLFSEQVRPAKVFWDVRNIVI